MPKNIKVTWVDHGLEPKNAPNKEHPNGVDIDEAAGRLPSCTVDLPYPAKRRGVYLIDCERCGFKIGVTTAGRADDPKSITVACKPVR